MILKAPQTQGLIIPWITWVTVYEKSDKSFMFQEIDSIGNTRKQFLQILVPSDSACDTYDYTPVLKSMT